MKPKIIYVMGAGRSGSTILGVALGNCSDIFYAGELDAWLRKNGISNFDGDQRQAFWNRVGQDMQHRMSLFGEESWRSIEHSSAALRYRSWRTRQSLRPRYRETAEELYLSIARESEAEYVVDTSHYPLRAREIQALAGVDLYLLYLVRRPQSVVASFSRDDVDQPMLNPFVANLYLYLTHALATTVFLRHRRDRRLLLRYEDFASDPERTLSELLAWIGSKSSTPNLAALTTGLAFQGNRLLRNETLAFRREGYHQIRDRRFTAFLQLPWALLFPYLRPSLPRSQSRISGA
jgi:hypothetical protein